MRKDQDGTRKGETGPKEEIKQKEQRCYLQRGVRALCARNETYKGPAKLLSLREEWARRTD